MRESLFSALIALAIMLGAMFFADSDLERLVLGLVSVMFLLTSLVCSAIEKSRREK